METINKNQIKNLELKIKLYKISEDIDYINNYIN